MNPIHVACFNELKELCRKYDLEISSKGFCVKFYFRTNDRPGVIFSVGDSYEVEYLNKHLNEIVRHHKMTIPPPEAKGEKCEAK